jgi:signal transduction histidine kinase
MAAMRPDEPKDSEPIDTQPTGDQPTGERKYGSPWARRAPWEARRFGPPPFGPHAWHGRRGRRSGWLFLRFAAIFGLLAVVVLGGLALLIFFVVRLAGGDRHTAALLWLGTCGLLFFFPLLTGLIGRRAFRSIAAPLARLMEGADRVAAGDLSVRVPAGGRGEFAQLSAAFNHMVEELALADQRRRNLTADVAHELRTPLQIIQGNLEGLVDGVYQPTPEHLEATLGETRLLARLIEDLRVLSQAEAGQLPMQWEPVDVAELLADAATSFSGQAQAAGVRLDVLIGGQPLPPDAPADTAAAATPGAPPLVLRGDYGRLAQVLGNLLANALRHTPAGGVVTLAAAATATGVRITVADTGEGIVPADLPFVFDRFWRSDRARTHSGGAGSGLGLAIARQLIQAHDGTITAASTPGQGTTFTLDLA